MLILKALGRVIVAALDVVAAGVVCLPHFYREYRRVRRVERIRQANKEA